MKNLNTSFNARLDADGYLVDPKEWDRQVAFDLATHAGIKQLSQKHWRIIERLRAYYARNAALPMIRSLCQETSLEQDCVSRLFGDPSVAWRIAGLPNPGEEPSAYMPTSSLA